MKFKRFAAAATAIMLLSAPHITKSVLSDSDFVKLDLIVELRETEGDFALFSVDTKTTAADSLDLEVTQTYDAVINGFAAEGTVADMKMLQSDPAVKNVYVARTYSVPEDIETGETAKRLAEVGEYAGTGKAVAVIDSEFRVTHEYFSQAVTSPKLSEEDVLGLTSTGQVSGGVYYSSKIPFMYDYNGEDTNVSGTTNHGTHVAGIVAGNSGQRQGTAPDAQLVLMKVFSDTGSGASDTVILKAVDDAVKLGVDVINMSFGDASGHMGNPSALSYEKVIAAAREYGISVCISSGNNGILGGGIYGTAPFPPTEVTDYGLLSSPASAPSAIAVAATNATGTNAADFSARGAAHNLALKPDLAGIGTLVSSVRTGDTSYSSKSGTSMAAPYATGSIAAVRQYAAERFPEKSGREGEIAELLLMNTASLMKSGGEYLSPRVQGAGLANAANACKSAVIVYSESGKGKAELYDGLDGSFSFDLYAENLGEDEVSYNLYCDVLTDAYAVSDGVNRITGKSAAVNAVVSFGESDVLTLAAGEKKKFTVSATYDGAESDVFPNGYYIEGFVRLENETASQLSVPFMGYEGDWGSQTAIDSGIVRNAPTIQNAFMKVIELSFCEGIGQFVVLPSGGALRLNRVSHLRNTAGGRAVITDAEGNVLKTEEIEELAGIKKSFVPSSGEPTTMDIPAVSLRNKNLLPFGDGEYYYNLYADVEYKNGEKESSPYRLRVLTDSVSPYADCVLKTDGTSAKCMLRVSDNYAVKSVSVGNAASTIGKASYNNIVETDITVTSTDEVTVFDYAGNSYELACEFIPGFICSYGEDGELIGVLIRNFPTDSGGRPQTELSQPATGSVRILIWDGAMRPISFDNIIG